LLGFGFFCFFWGIKSGIWVEKKWTQAACNFSKENNPFPAKTQAPNSTKFLAVGDFGEANGHHQKIALAAREYCLKKGCDFGLLLGDNFYETGVKSIFDPLWKEIYQNFWAPLKIPFYAVLGNHDVKGNAQAQYDYGLIDKNWVMPSPNYTFQTPNADFFAINTNCNVFSLRQLKKDFQATQANQNWKIVLGHHPVYGYSGHYANNWLFQKYWERNFEKKIDFYLAGHNHNLELIEKKDAKTVYLTSGSASRLHETLNFPQAKEPFVLDFQGNTNGFAWVELKEKAAQIHFLNEDGKEIYTKNFSKK